MTAVLPASNGLIFDSLGAAAGKGAVIIDQSFLQRGGHGKYLKCRARLIGIVERFVSPKIQQNFTVLFIVVIAAEIVQLIEQRGVFLRNHARIVQIKIRLGGHRQDLAGLDVHDNAADALFGAGLRQHFFQMLFQIVLHALIQRCHNAVAVFGSDIFFIVIRHIRAKRIGRFDHAACHALEHIIILQLQAVQTLSVIVRKADDLRGKIAVFIIALGILRRVDAGELFIAEFLHQFIRNIRIDMPCDTHIGLISLYLF